MIYINKKIFLEKIIVSFVFVAFIALNYFVFFGKNSVIAQSIDITAVAIGGKTEGVSDLCCNGIILDFESIDSGNPWILDGEAIFVPISSQSYDHGNEFTEGYYTLGKLSTGICLTITSECESADVMPQIKVIGTGGAQANGGVGF